MKHVCYYSLHATCVCQCLFMLSRLHQNQSNMISWSLVQAFGCVCFSNSVASIYASLTLHVIFKLAMLKSHANDKYNVVLAQTGKFCLLSRALFTLSPGQQALLIFKPFECKERVNT